MCTCVHVHMFTYLWSYECKQRVFLHTARTLNLLSCNAPSLKKMTLED